MPGKGYVDVHVAVEGGRVLCREEWVNCFWDKGPDNIRWVFVKAPAEAEWAEIEFLDEVPPKYAHNVSGFLNRGPFRGMGFRRPSGGTQLQDMVTLGNTKEKGYFCYNIYVYDANGKLLAHADPGGTNDPDRPSTPHP